MKNDVFLDGSIFGLLLFLIYVNDLLVTISSQSKPISFTDDPSVTISHLEIKYFQNFMNDVFASLNKLFKTNKHTLNFDNKFMKQQNLC